MCCSDNRRNNIEQLLAKKLLETIWVVDLLCDNGRLVQNPSEFLPMIHAPTTLQDQAVVNALAQQFLLAYALDKTLCWRCSERDGSLYYLRTAKPGGTNVL